MKVHALSLWQPWASLIAIGAKRIETRHWSTSYRGPLVIHAAKTRNELAMCWNEPFRTVLEDAKKLPPITRRGEGRAELNYEERCHFIKQGVSQGWMLPLGALVCVVDLMDCVPTEQLQPDEPENHFGNYAPGRFGWMLENIRPLPHPMPYRGGQGLFCVETDLLNGVSLTEKQPPPPLQSTLF